jgi:hypothetical protein
MKERKSKKVKIKKIKSKRNNIRREI